MPKCEILVQVEGAAGSAGGPVGDAWVYILDGSTLTTYRTTAEGRLRATEDGAPASAGTRPWKYTKKALLDVPKTVRIYTSTGARPIPVTELNGRVFNNAHAYGERPFTLPPAPPANAVAASQETVIAMPVATILAPPVVVALTSPVELSFCPVLWNEAPAHDTDDAKDYLRAGVAQAAAAHLDAAPAPAPPAGVLPTVRGVKLQGTIDGRAHHVRLRLLDAAGAVLGLQETVSGARVDERVVATAAQAGQRGFSVDVWLHEPLKAFGLVHVMVESADDGEERHVLGAFTVFFVGLQVALVDDGAKDLAGTKPGDVVGEAQEAVVVDFKKSPVRDAPSSDLFLAAHKALTKQAQVAAGRKAKRTQEVVDVFHGARKPLDAAAAALTAAAGPLPQVQAKLAEAKAKIAEAQAALAGANDPGAKITAAKQSEPAVGATSDAAFDAAMTALGAGFTAVNEALGPATAATTTLGTQLTAADHAVDAAVAALALEAAAAGPARDPLHAARVTQTTAAGAAVAAAEAARAAAEQAGSAAHRLVTAPAGPVQTALKNGEARRKRLHDDARDKCNAELAKQQRGRRMVTYPIRGTRLRKLGENGPEIVHPEMPLWMAELHLFGAVQAPVTELLERRRRRLPGDLREIRLRIDWRLHLGFRGPDKDDHGYTFAQDFRGVWTATKLQAVPETVILRVGDDDQMVLDGDALQAALEPPPVALPFPVSGRRAPVAAIANRTRPWGRRPGAPTGPALVVEWQIPIVDGAGREILRGGDGVLTIAALTIDGHRVDPGVFAPRPAPTADLALVPFRVRGEDPSPTPFDQMDSTNPTSAAIEAVVAEMYAALPASAAPCLIDVAGWKLAMRRTIWWESDHGHQFVARTQTIFCHDEPREHAWSHGVEKGMPLFGFPHGYTISQCDPHPSDDAMWGYLDGIRAGTHVLFGKAGDARSAMSHHLDPTDPLHREALLRQSVRFYNGGQGYHEFEWTHPPTTPPATPPANTWMIVPTHDYNIDYPNQVLGTHVDYTQSRPIVFAPEQFVLPGAPAGAAAPAPPPAAPPDE